MKRGGDFELVIVILLAVYLLAGCASAGAIKPGFQAGCAPGYLYASEIDPGVIITEWKMSHRADDGYGGIWERYENPGAGEPRYAVAARGGYGELCVYAYSLNGRLRAFESFQDGHIFTFREIEWSNFTLPLKYILEEMVGLAGTTDEGRRTRGEGKNNGSI